VYVRLLERKRAPDEGDVIAIKEFIWNMGWKIWPCRKLGVSGYVNAPEGDLAVV
jgi:hypothetical protein